MQPVGELVEVGEPGRHTDQLAVAVVDRLDLVERRLHDRAQRRVVLRGSLVGDAVDLGLCPVDHVVDLSLAGVPHLGDPGARVDQPTQDRLLAHDVGVVGGVRGDRDARRERVEVRRATDAHQLTAPLQLGGGGDRVDRLASTVEVDHHVEDRLVGGSVEVTAADRLDDVGDRVLGQQHRTQHALLGVVVLRRGAVTATATTEPGDGRRPGPVGAERRFGVVGEPTAGGRDAHERLTRCAALLVTVLETVPARADGFAQVPDDLTANSDVTGPDDQGKAGPPQGPGDNRGCRVDQGPGRVCSLCTPLWRSPAAGGSTAADLHEHRPRHVDRRNRGKFNGQHPPRGRIPDPMCTGGSARIRVSPRPDRLHTAVRAARVTTSHGS